MKLSEIVQRLNLEVKTGAGRLDENITRGYASDLLSDVIAHGREKDLWITLQTHQNIVAVALMKSLAGIVLVNGRQPEEDTLRKGEAETVPILVSTMPAFEVVGRLFELGISGR